MKGQDEVNRGSEVASDQDGGGEDEGSGAGEEEVLSVE